MFSFSVKLNMTVSTTPWLIGFSAIIWFILRLYRGSCRGSNLPPGPPTTPFLGNLLDIPRKSSYLQYTKWAKEYGDIFSLKGGPNGTIVVLTSPEAIYEVLEKQGGATAGRSNRTIIQRITRGLMVGLSQPSKYTP